MGPRAGIAQATNLPVGRDVGEVVRVRLAALFRSPTYTPPMLPAIALELLEMSRKPDASIRDVSALLSKDQLLSAKLLSIARSPAYGIASVSSMEDVVARLGLCRVSELFMRASVEARVFRAPGFDGTMARLRKHSVFVAEMARHIARTAAGNDRNAYLCGLLHDVGTAAAIVAMTDLTSYSVKPCLEDIWQGLRPIHAECGELVARSWELPGEIIAVVSDHHHCKSRARVHPVTASVALADALSNEVQLGMLDETSGEDIALLCEILEVDDDHLQSLRHTATELLCNVL